MAAGIKSTDVAKYEARMGKTKAGKKTVVNVRLMMYCSLEDWSFPSVEPIFFV